MNDPIEDRMRDLLWRHELTASEVSELRTLLANHPEKREEMELEAVLNELLERLPDAPPVASNFTARVLQTVALENAARSRRRDWPWWARVRSWLPRAAAAMVVVGVGCLLYFENLNRARATMAGDMAQIAEIVSASDPSVMENFEAIRRLGEPRPQADTELLAMQF